MPVRKASEIGVVKGGCWVYRPDHPEANENGMVPRHLAGHPGEKSGLQIIPDIQPFKSPIDGKVISSRPQIREHEREHGVRQIGNDYHGEKPKWWDNRKEIARTGKVEV